MKKMTSIALMGLFTFSLATATNNNVELDEIFTPDCKATIRVDCDGDGQAEMEGTVNCEFAQALQDQMVAACR